MSRFDINTGLSASGVSISYGGAAVIEGLDLTIPQGAFTALIGPNGSGKSTILRALGGFLTPNAGQINLNGSRIGDLTTRDIARQIAVLAQGPVAPEGLTVMDLVRQGRYPHRSLFSSWSLTDDQACNDALALARMKEFAHRSLESLSGGQRQRAWIAMTLAQETPILLLDEPTTYLDLAHQIEVMELIAELVATRKKTVVAVLHDLNQAARHADHMVLMKAGKIVATGKPGDVMSEALIGDVFGLAVTVVPDPVTGTPMCVPLRRQLPSTA